jgi:hypothetical protein
MSKSILVLGYNSRYIACSAYRAGYKVYSVSHYDDLDLLKCVESYATFDDMPENIEPWLKKYKVDHVVLGSGFEDAPIDKSLVLGNDPAICKNVMNKVWLGKKLRELGMPHPEIYSRKNVRFPCIAKPIRGGGGHKNFLVLDESMIPSADEYFLQEYLTGRPLSVSVLSSKHEAVPIALNEILVGKKWLGQDLAFGYCGNVTPYRTRFHDRMYDIAKRLIKSLGLVGSNGIDFIVNENGPYVLEINTRFQGTVDTVEIATGKNLFKAHVDAINGDPRELPIKRFGYKTILFARKKTLVKGNMTHRMLADIPAPGKVYERNEAIVTALGKGDTRGEAAAMMKKAIHFARKNLKTL